MIFKESFETIFKNEALENQAQMTRGFPQESVKDSLKIRWRFFVENKSGHMTELRGFQIIIIIRN